MKKEIKVIVSVAADSKYCDPRECDYCYFGTCTLFNEPIDRIATNGKYIKCSQCLNARTKDEPVKWHPDGAGSFRRSE